MPKHGEIPKPLNTMHGDKCVLDAIKKRPWYHRYGGRGITYDPRWEDYTVFLADMGRRPSAKHTLERKELGIGG